MMTADKLSVVSNKIKGLYAIVDNTFSQHMSHYELASLLLIGGCRTLQLRIKKENPSSWDKNVFEIAKEIKNLKKRYDFTFIINDYVDVAAEIRADGVHVGVNDAPIEEIKSRVGNRLFVGYSSHSIAEALDAEKRGADYVALGAVFPTQTKGPGHPVQGLDTLKTLVSRVQVPVVAIGGIKRSNIGDVMSTGVCSVAMITALTQAKNIVTETSWYVKKIKYFSQKKYFAAD